MKKMMVAAAILTLPAVVWSYGGQAEDDDIVRQAMRQGIINAHPFPLDERWADWVSNCGDFLSYRSNCIRRWEEVAEATGMTAEQRAKAEALHEKYQKIHNQFDETTTPVRNKLEDRMEQAKQAGDEALAKRLDRLRHVQTHQKLAIEGGASEHMLRLVTPQQLRKWHEYRVSKHAVKKMRKRLLNRKVGEKKLVELLELTSEQLNQLEHMAWKIAREDFLPTVEHSEDVSAFAIYGEHEKRAWTLADEKLYPEVVRTVLTDAQRKRLALARGLELKPCTIELVDGTTLIGRVAIQFDMPEHLIVYSPRLATVRSFLKKHVYTIVVNGKREQLDSSRPLTDIDRKLLGRLKWPEETPEKGRRPAYTHQRWQAPRQLLVWARPGKSGRLEEPENWLLNGERLSAMQFTKEQRRADGDAFNVNTDILLPDADTSYTVGYNDRARGGFKARHITIGNNARLKSSILTVAGNVRIVRRGRLRVRYTIALKGDRHTFFHNDKPPFTAKQNNALEGGYPAANYVNGIGYGVAQYLRVQKSRLASVEFIGTVQTSDDFQMPSGITIVAPNAQLMPGKRSTQRIGRDAVLRLHSGSQFCKAENATYYDNDLIVEGGIEAGTNENPITRDCLLGISFKDRSHYNKDGPSVTRAAPGLVFKPTASVEVHTVDPKTARLVVCWHGRENTWQRSRMKAESGKDYMALPRKIEIEVHGQLALDAVLFDDVHRGGIQLADPRVRAEWKNIFFASDNDAPPDELFGSLSALEKKGSRS